MFATATSVDLAERRAGGEVGVTRDERRIPPWLSRPAVILAVILGIYFLFPNLRMRQVELRAGVPPCGEQVVFEIYRDEVKGRAYKELIRDRVEVVYSAWLSEGPHEIHASVVCADGTWDPPKIQRLVVGEVDRVDFDLADRCACPTGAQGSSQ